MYNYQQLKYYSIYGFRKFKSVIVSPFLKYQSHKIKNVNGVLFELDFSLGPLIRDIYFDYYEIQTKNLFKELLNKGETLIDVGANVGYLSAIGASIVGENGQIHSFEPVPPYFNSLSRLVQLNNSYNIYVNNYALGEKDGTAEIDIDSSNIGWNTMVPNFMEKPLKTYSIQVKRLDEYIESNSLESISLIKIDTEGYEFPVLKGLQKFLDNTNEYPTIICEIAPAAYPLLNLKLEDLLEYMTKYSYNTFDKFKRELDVLKLRNTTDVIFVPK